MWIHLYNRDSNDVELKIAIIISLFAMIWCDYDGPDVTPFIHTFICESTVKTTLNLTHTLICEATVSSSCFITHMSLCMNGVTSGPSYASDKWLFVCLGDATQSDVFPSLGLGRPGALLMGLDQPCPKPSALIHKTIATYCQCFQTVHIILNAGSLKIKPPYMVKNGGHFWSTIAHDPFE